MAKPFNLKADYLGEDLYKVLGISSQSTKADIKSAYRKRQKETHQDVLSINGLKNTDIDSFIIDAFNTRRGDQDYAYQILYDDETRSFYDQQYSAFKEEITNRRSKKRDEVASRDANYEEASNIVSQLRKKSEAQNERRRELERTKDELQKRREGIRTIPAEAANVILLTKQIAELDKDLAECDRPVRELNEEFKSKIRGRKEQDAERGKQERLRVIDETIRQQRERMKIAKEGLAGRRDGEVPPGENPRHYWDRQFRYAESGLDDLMIEQRKLRGEDAPSGENETGDAGDAGEGNTRGGGRKKPDGEGEAPGEEGSKEEEGAAPGEEGDDGAPDGEGGPGFHFSDENQQEPPQGTLRDRLRARYDKFQRGRREGQQKKSHKRAEKDETNAEREREREQQRAESDQAREERREERDQRRQEHQEARRERWSRFKDWGRTQYGRAEGWGQAQYQHFVQDRRDAARTRREARNEREMRFSQEGEANRRTATERNKQDEGSHAGGGGEAKG